MNRISGPLRAAGLGVGIGALAVGVAFALVGPTGATPPHPQLADMSVARAAHQATRLPSGEVLITGGCAANGCEQILASAEIYDPRQETFRTVAPMATTRASHDATLLDDGRVLVSGGWTGSAATASAEIYDPVANRWMTIAPMGTARMSHNTVALPQGKFFVVGGNTPATAERFDPVTERFTPIPGLPPSEGQYLALGLADGRVLITGGKSPAGEVLDAAQVYDPVANTFRPVGRMNTPRHKHAAVLLQDGQVMILGGSDARDGRGRYTSTEFFDPTRNQFTRGPDMIAPRYKIRDAVVVLPSGAVLVAGGAEDAELFDPGTGRFMKVSGSRSAARMFATATLLPNQAVLVLGGYDERIRPSADVRVIRADQ